MNLAEAIEILLQIIMNGSIKVTRHNWLEVISQKYSWANI